MSPDTDTAPEADDGDRDPTTTSPPASERVVGSREQGRRPGGTPRTTRSRHTAAGAPGLNRETLHDVLADARTRGFLGGNVDVEDHIRNGIGFARVIEQEPVELIMDIGSGGGVPALIIANHLANVHLVLIERSTTRAAFLEEAIVRLHLTDRVHLVVDDAEAVARDPDLTGSADVVTARSFGAPAITAEAACRLLRIGGRLIVSEPPAITVDDADVDAGASDPNRWPADELQPTGLVPTARHRFGGSTYQVLHRRHPVDARLPRRAAVTRKRPLYPSAGR